MPKRLSFIQRLKKRISGYQPDMWMVSTNLVMWLMAYAVWDSFFEYLPTYHLVFRYVSVFAPGIAAVGLLSHFVSPDKKYGKWWKPCTIVSGVALLLTGAALPFDFDKNSISNYTELAIGLNPWVQDNKQNAEPEKQANLIDGCIVYWVNQGYDLNYDKLPLDIDGDGCFDEVERVEGGDLPFDATAVPSFIEVSAAHPSKTSIANPRWKIYLGTGGTLASSYNPQVLSWQSFRFNNRRQFDDYVLILDLTSGHSEKTISMKCPKASGEAKGDALWTHCPLTSAQTQEIADFIVREAVSEISARWQVQLGSVRLFEKDSDWNRFTIILPALNE